ncbi:hypothetical protein RvY_16931 [Ramazzottius varieornatus]|uniref:Uncharacterized protein n=1 Tax=Ramazzottius varieornatus TaxID=947166 RepID=A0A1D1W2S6_RAMVA|nr:hypothetical protein RvY_16931 [Ramazzottius varieornatus]
MTDPPMSHPKIRSPTVQNTKTTPPAGPAPGDPTISPTRSFTATAGKPYDYLRGISYAWNCGTQKAPKQLASDEERQRPFPSTVPNSNTAWDFVVVNADGQPVAPTAYPGADESDRDDSTAEVVVQPSTGLPRQPRPVPGGPSLTTPPTSATVGKPTDPYTGITY